MVLLNFLFSLLLGLSGSPSDIENRKKIFGVNEIPKKPPKTFIKLVLIAGKEPTLLILLVAAIISLGLTVYTPQDQSQGKSLITIN